MSVGGREHPLDGALQIRPTAIQVPLPSSARRGCGELPLTGQERTSAPGAAEVCFSAGVAARTLQIRRILTAHASVRFPITVRSPRRLCAGAAILTTSDLRPVTLPSPGS